MGDSEWLLIVVSANPPPPTCREVQEFANKFLKFVGYGNFSICLFGIVDWKSFKYGLEKTRTEGKCIRSVYKLEQI